MSNSHKFNINFNLCSFDNFIGSNSSSEIPSSAVSLDSNFSECLDNVIKFNRSIDTNFCEINLTPPETPVGIEFASVNNYDTSYDGHQYHTYEPEMNYEVMVQMPYNYITNNENIEVSKKKRGRKPRENIPEYYVCTANNCQKTFKRNEHLKRHIRSVHTLEKPYVCNIDNCGKRFSRSDNLSQHYKIHSKKMIMNNSGFMNTTNYNNMDSQLVYPSYL